MRTAELISPTQTMAAKVARQLVHAAAKAYVPEDVEKAAYKALLNFYDNMKKEAANELRMVRLRKIPNSQ